MCSTFSPTGIWVMFSTDDFSHVCTAAKHRVLLCLKGLVHDLLKKKKEKLTKLRLWLELLREFAALHRTISLYWAAPRWRLFLCTPPLTQQLTSPSSLHRSEAAPRRHRDTIGVELRSFPPYLLTYWYRSGAEISMFVRSTLTSEILTALAAYTCLPAFKASFRSFIYMSSLNVHTLRGRCILYHINGDLSRL